MVTRFLGGGEVDLWVPPAGELFDGGNIDRSIVQVVIDLGQEPGDEGAVYRNGVSREGGLA